MIQDHPLVRKYGLAAALILTDPKYIAALSGEPIKCSVCRCNVASTKETNHA
jgi:hypothetical protein